MEQNKYYSHLSHLRKFLLFYPIVVMFVVFIATIGVIYLTFKSYFYQEKENVKHKFFCNLKKITKQRVITAKNILHKVYQLELENEKEKLQKILEIIINKNPRFSNIIIKISNKPLNIDTNKYIYVVSYKNGKYYYALESKELIKNKIKNSIPKLFDALKWGGEKKGYIFVHDTKGVCYYHIDKSLIGKNRWNLKRNGVYILRKLTKAALANPEGTYVKYLAYNPDGKPIEKISFILYDKKFGLTIGSGVYLKDLQHSLQKLEREKKTLLNELFDKLFTIFLISIIGFTILLYFITSFVIKRFEEYNNIITRLEIEKEEKECIDELTKLLKKDCLQKTFNKLKNKDLAIIVIDINDFKNIYDLYGRETSYKVITILANKIRRYLKATDIIGKGKFDEFIVLLEYKQKKNIENVVKRLYEILNKPLKVDNNTIIPHVRIGITLNKKDGKDFMNLVSKATRSAINVKNEDIRIGYYNKNIDSKIKEYLQIKEDLEKAIENKQFEQFKLFYQPQIDKNENLAGMEALIRWEHPSRGLVSPGVFLPIAINEGLIKKIDIFVMEEVIKQINEWVSKGYNPGVVSCNVTMKTLENKNYLRIFKELLENVDVKYFGIEVTEESIAKENEKVRNVLSEIKKLGVSIALDDFGTGYSNLSKLKEMPIDKLKIDKSFIDGIPNDKSDVELTQIIINVGKILNFKLIAEGVETKEQKEFVITHGVDLIQGYYYSKPLPPEEIEKKYFRN